MPEQRQWCRSGGFIFKRRKCTTIIDTFFIFQLKQINSVGYYNLSDFTFTILKIDFDNILAKCYSKYHSWKVHYQNYSSFNFGKLPFIENL